MVADATGLLLDVHHHCRWDHPGSLSRCRQFRREGVLGCLEGLHVRGVGLFTGLLANGGGFLLVPMYLLVFGLTMRESAGTSLLVIAILAVPTLATHWALGHIGWAVAGAFALGAVPSSFGASRLAQHIAGPRLRHAFGWFLIGSGIAFVLYRILGT